jgi:hypothetical protein
VESSKASFPVRYPSAGSSGGLPPPDFSRVGPLAEIGRTALEAEGSESPAVSGKPLQGLEMPGTDERRASGCGSITLDCPIGQFRSFFLKTLPNFGHFLLVQAVYFCQN